MQTKLTVKAKITDAASVTIKCNSSHFVPYRTRQTEEEVMKLEKIKKELQVLDGQFSQEVNVLRKKIEQACITYTETE